LTPAKTSIYSAASKNYIIENMSKKYIPTEKEKYMCAKHKAYFKKRLVEWRSEIIQSNAKSLYLTEIDHEISSPDIVDQASSQTEKTVEMRTLNRQRKLISKIDKAIKRINDNTYGYCEETGEPIGIKRLIARPIATLSIEAQEKHEKNEKIFADV
jgi:DnaK suppressor protein